MISRRTLLGTSLAAATPLSNAAFAQDYPRRSIQIIVPANAGGPSDVGARILASIMEKDIGQSVLVVNKPGAGAQLGLTDIARAKPDGYTLGVVHMPGTNTIILDPDRKAAFNTDSFILVCNQVLDPGVIWVRVDSPYKTLADLVDAAKQTPGKLSACTTGILSDDHLAVLMLQEAANISFRIVHFDGAAQQFTAILGGHVDVAFDNVGSVRKRAQAGEVRVLAVMDSQRSKLMPESPTSAELGFPTVISSSTRGFGVPKGTPPAVVKYLEAALKKAMENPEHIRRMEEVGLEIRIMTGAEYAKYFADQHAIATKYTEWAKKMQ
jgi:tripartite-type tricarboxylate transporter receptor subunit TctC